MKVLSRQQRVETLGAAVVFVVHDEPERIRASLLRELEVPFPVAIDLDRNAYRAWGCVRSSFARIWLDPRVWARYTRSALKAGRPVAFGKDTLQLGGDFVVDPKGRIAYARPQRRDDRPPVAVLLRALQEACDAGEFRDT